MNLTFRPRRVFKISLLISSLFLLHVSCLEAQNDDFGKSNGASVFYSIDERDLSLASKFDRANVRTISYGAESIFNDVGVPFGIMVVHSETSVSLYGMDGSKSLESSLSTQGSGFYEYQGSIETGEKITMPLNKFWDAAKFPDLPSQNSTYVSIPGTGGTKIPVSKRIENAYLEGMRDYLSAHARRKGYKIPIEETYSDDTTEKVTHYDRIREEFERFNDSIDIDELYKSIRSKLEDLNQIAPEEGVERFLDEFRSRIENMSRQYKDLAQSYLDHWREQLENSDYEVQFRTQASFNYDISLGISEWNVGVESKENAVYIALPLDINKEKTKRLVVRAGLAEITSSAEFVVFKIVGRADTKVNVEGDIELRNGETSVAQESFDFGTNETIEVPFDLKNHPLYLRSPKRTYTLILAGIGYYNKNRTAFFAEVGVRKSDYRNDGIERVSLSFSQRIKPWLSAGINAHWRQLATPTDITQRNIKEEILEQKEVDELNRDVREGRDYFGEGVLSLFVNIGEGVSVKLGEIELLGPNLWFRNALWANVSSKWRCGIGWEQYQLLLLEGTKTSMNIDNLLSQIPYENLGDNLESLNIEGYHVFKDPRIKEDRYSFGVAYANEKAEIENSLEFTDRDFRAYRTRGCLKGIKMPLLGIKFDIEAGTRVDFQYQNEVVKVTSGWFRMTRGF